MRENMRTVCARISQNELFEVAMRKRITQTICLALCLLTTVLSAVVLIACNSVYTNTPGTPEPQKATSFVCVDVNPSVELVLDQNNVVMSACGANTDGKALLFEEDGIVGADLDVAIGNVAALSVKYGYISDGANVSVEVTSTAENNDIFEKISAKFASAIKNANPSLTISISDSCDFVLQSELDALKSKNSDNLTIQNLDVATYRLVKRAQQNGVSVEDSLSLPLDKLITEANDFQSDLNQKFDDEYQLAINRAQYVFNNAKQTVENGVYARYFVQKLLDTATSNPRGAIEVAGQALNAAKYAASSASKLSLEFYLACSDYFDQNPVYELTQEQLGNISCLLGTRADDFKTKYSTKNGTIRFTKTELDSFVNTVYRSDESARADIQSAYGNTVKYLLQFAQEDETDLSVAKEATKSVATYIKSALSLADSVMSSLPFVKFDVDSILAACIPSDVDYESRKSVESAIERLETQASQAKEQMKVTKEDEAAIRTMLAQSETVKAIDSARTALNEALDKAKSDARALLLSLKSARLA